MQGDGSHTNIPHEMDACLPDVAMRSTTLQHIAIPPTPRFLLHKKAATDRIPTPLINPIDQTPKATLVQEAIIALGIISGLLIFGILLFMLLFCHYRKKKMEYRVVARLPFIPRSFPNSRQQVPLSRMDDDPRGLEPQHMPEPVGSRETHSAATQRQGYFSSHSGRQSQMKGEDIGAAQRQRAFSPQSGRHSQMQPGNMEAVAAQRQRAFSAQSARRGQMHDGMDMDAVAALAQRQRGPTAQSIRRSNLQEDIDLDTAAARRQGALSAQSARHSHLQEGDLQPNIYGAYGSGLGTAHAQGLPPMTPQPFYQGDGFTIQIPEPVQTQGLGNEYSMEDHLFDG